ncbi:MAG: DUF433 domain-containing protein [Dehalococcoidia bacterium]|nr:DUF433 domain-containing protein [Dehalococcoidia bacterium]
MNLRDYITVNSESEACIAETDVPVSVILDKLADGLDVNEITRSFPSVSKDAIKAAILYASELARHVGLGHDDVVANVSRDDVLETLRANKPVMVERFGITDLALFGSYARDTAVKGSDVDILVGFDGRATSKAFFGLQAFLEDLLRRRVDLVTQNALRPELRPRIEQEAVHV